MSAFSITIFGILLGLISSLTGITWLTILAAVVAFVGSYLQYKNSVPYELIFSESSWKHNGKGENSTSLVIPKRWHKESNPTATVFFGRSPNFEQGIGDAATDADGNITLYAGKPFAGKVVVR